MPTPKEIAEAWHSVTDRWFVRRNKARDHHQWECVHDWGEDMKDVGWFSTEDEAEECARALEDEARGEAVLRSLGLIT